MKTFKKICGFVNVASDGLKQWTKLGLLWLLLTFILRLGFFFVMLFTGKVELSSFLTVLSGVYFDITVVFFTAVTLLIPFLLINHFLPRLNNVLSLIFITLYVIVYGMLIAYFSNVGQPLDRVFFVYDIKEQINIIASSVKFLFLVGISFRHSSSITMLLRFCSKVIPKTSFCSNSAGTKLVSICITR